MNFLNFIEMLSAQKEPEVVFRLQKDKLNTNAILKYFPRLGNKEKFEEITNNTKSNLTFLTNFSYLCPMTNYSIKKSFSPNKKFFILSSGNNEVLTYMHQSVVYVYGIEFTRELNFKFKLAPFNGLYKKQRFRTIKYKSERRKF